MKAGLYTIALAILLSSLFAGCGPGRTPAPEQAGKEATQRSYTINSRRYYPIPSAEGYREQGLASWYGKKFHGRRTANGEIYNMHAKTAAHKTLPMNTVLLVRNLKNGRTTVVRINDRGPFVNNRIIDLSYRAAKELSILHNGTARVEITAMAEAPQVVAGKKRKAGQPVKKKHREFSKGKFYVQVGAFEDIEQAKKLARAFAAKGRDVVIQQFPAAGISLYRVMVYSGTSLAEAHRYEKKLEGSGYPDALIIAR